MASFPCPGEQIAASALLLLSTTTPPPDFPSIFDFDLNSEVSVKGESKIRSCRGSYVFSDSRSISSEEDSDLSSDERSPRSTRIVSSVPRGSVMKLMVVRKSRSKIHIHKSSRGRKFSSGETTVTSSGESASTESSCLTTGCSAGSRARSRGYVTRAKEVREEQKRKHVGSNHIRRRAQGILNLLSDRSYSEVTIRQLLGDSPDTSKALRMLLKLEEVKRTGTGGRQDPYIYMKASQI